MLVQKAQQMIKDYLNEHFIQFIESEQDGQEVYILAFYGLDKVPSGMLEGSIYFYDKLMEMRIYYDEATANLCKSSEHRGALYELINYINATVWPMGQDGLDDALYTPTHLFVPRMYITEEGRFDITMTTLLPYDFFEVAPLESEDFFTAAMPDLLNNLSAAIYPLLLGKADIEQAKEIVDSIGL